MQNTNGNSQPVTGRRLIRWLWLIAALVQLTASAANSVWQRVVVIGASASGGFVLSEPFGGTNTAKCKLNYYLDAALAAPHEPTRNLGTSLLFLSPDALGLQQIEAATNCQPTLVIGVDFLFWFCYGQGPTDAERAEHFEKGLRLLERILCPLVIGDIPDASSATNTGIISIAQIPSEAARTAANQRLRAWAATRPNVSIVPLANFMRAVNANQAVQFHHLALPAGKTRALLQTDRLHPNPRGAAMVSLVILDTFMAGHTDISASDIRWNWEEVYQLGQTSAQSAQKPATESGRR